MNRLNLMKSMGRVNWLSRRCDVFAEKTRHPAAREKRAHSIHLWVSYAARKYVRIAMRVGSIKSTTFGFALLLSLLNVTGLTSIPDRVAKASDIPADLHDAVPVFAFSQDGNTLATVGEDGWITLLGLESGEELGVIGDPSVDAPTSVAFSPDGTTLASVSEGTITLWDLELGEQRVSHGDGDGGVITQIRFNPDGRSLAAVVDRKRILVWELETGAHMWSFSTNDVVAQIVFSADGQYLASHGSGPRITLWDIRSGQRHLTLTTPDGTSIASLAFSPFGGTLASAEVNGNITLWDPKLGQPKQFLFGHKDTVSDFAFNPDGTRLASGGLDTQIKLWSLGSGEEQRSLPGHFGAAITTLLFSPDGQILASVGEDTGIMLWDVSSGELTQVLVGHRDFVAGAVFSSNQLLLASIAMDGQVIVWDVETGLERYSRELNREGVGSFDQQAVGMGNYAAERDVETSVARSASEQSGPATTSRSVGDGTSTAAARATARGTSERASNGARTKEVRRNIFKGILALAVSTDGKLLSSAGADGVVRLFNESGKELAALKRGAAKVTGVAFSANGKQLLGVGKDTALSVWDVKKRRLVKTLLAHEHPIRAVARSGNGKYIATAGEETRVMLWDAKKNKLQAILSGHIDFVNGLAFSNDNRLLASAGADGRILLWDVRRGTLLATLLGHAGEVNVVLFSQDNKQLISGSADTTVKIWNVSTERQIHSLEAHNAAIRAVAISPNGKYLASAGEDTRIILWNPVTGKPQRALTGAKAFVNALVFKPNGHLFVADENSEILKLDVETNETLDVIKSVEETKSSRVLETSSISPSMLTSADESVSIKGKPTTDPNNGGSTDSLVAQMLGRLLNWAIPAATAAPLPNPDVGPGGPILVIKSPAASFGDYYAEILRNEGFNAFAVLDLAAVSELTLSAYDVVILAPASLSAAQVTMFSNWVTAGGNLIAMRPDPQLAGTLGLTSNNSTLSEGYLLIDTAASPGNGIVGETIQFHGTADRYTLNGASAVATLYSDATTATANPAVTLQGVGSNGGEAAAFTYDLATSIVYTRQGNPTWEAQERDGFPPIRSDDKYYGEALGDPQADWVDLNKVAIPQADEQQRLLANLIIQMNLDKKPLPRFWYFPRGERAVVVMTGDDHGNGGTIGRFDQFIADSPPGCSVADWECVRGTSYIFPDTPLTIAQAVAYEEQGFEVGLHVNTDCSDYTFASLDTFYSQQIADFMSKYTVPPPATSVPPPATQRHHCIVWSDWVTGAKVQLNHGVRLDTSYYFWPSSWVLNRTGFFNGSGMPMRFADLDGSLIDVYQAATQMTDESGQEYPFTIDSLLDKALGSQGYFGAFTINAHTDIHPIVESAAVVASALARGVPVVSSRQMLEWIDGRNSSTFGALAWDGDILTFSITSDVGANGLRAIVPMFTTAGQVTTITRNGSGLGFEAKSVKGIQYAEFHADSGSYVVTYAPDLEPPILVSALPVDGSTFVSQGTTIAATFDEAMDAASFDDTNFQLDSNNTQIEATLSYDAASRSAILSPTTTLSAGTTYTATVIGGSTGPADISGNRLADNTTWSFTTLPPLNCPCTVWSDLDDAPAVASSGDPNAVELGVRFLSEVDGYITGVRFYKGAGNTGTHTGNLWDSGGTLLTSASFTNETASGWQQVDFSPAVAIAANTVYVASYHAPNGNYAADGAYFASAGVDNYPLRALQDGESGGNGLYVYGGGGFPTGTFNAANYWVDVVFDDVAPPDTLPPTVSSNAPSDGAVDVSAAADVVATFDEPLDAGTINTATFELRDPTGALVSATVVYDAASRRAIVTPSFLLEASTQYSATVIGGNGGAADLAGNNLANDFTWTFTTEAAPTCPCTVWDDVDVPTNPSEADPGAVELGVKFQANVDGFVTGIRFYKSSSNTGLHVGNLWSSDGTLLETATFTNETASGWQQVDFGAPVAINANTVYVASYHAPNGNYAADPSFFAASGVDSGYLTVLRNGVSGGNGVYAYSTTSTFPDFSFQASNYWVDVVFTNNSGPDTTPPAVTAQSPQNGATSVNPLAAVSATFNEGLDAGTISTATLELRDAVDALVSGTVAYETASRVATFTPDVQLEPTQTYTVTIRGGSTDPRVKDLAGNALVNDVTWSFTTATSGLSLWGNSTLPSVLADPDTSAIEIGVKFRSDVDGDVSGIRYYKSAVNTGVHVGSLWTVTGQLLARASFNGETNSGWQQADFATPVTISANSVYIASYHTNEGQYSIDSGYFSATGYDNAPLHALSDGTNGGNGVYAYSDDPVFPTDSVGASNYWVDVVFTVAPDTSPPVVTTTTPLDGTSSVGVGTAITATFNEPIDAATITPAAFELRDSIGQLVPATVTYDAAGNTAVLTPDSELTESTTYTATIHSGPGGPTDLAGNLLAANVAWSFTTGETVCCTVWSDSDIPANPSEADPSAVELGVKFRADVSGFITGVRFYKGSGNTGTHVGNLWDNNGTLLATATFAGETAIGWQQVDFGTPVAISANTIYIASYHAPNGNYAADASYFTGSGVDSPPLRLLQDGVSGGNGVYAYSTSSTFPSNTFQASNYWADVVFTTDNELPPEVTTTNPLADATDVQISSVVEATFSEAMDATSITNSTFELRDGSDTLVPTAVAYDPATFTATLTPSSPLASIESYTASLKGGLVEPRIRDLSGDALSSDLTWSFVTALDACSTPANPIVAENCLVGNPSSEWDISGAGDPTIQGFATDISVDQGETVSFKIDTDASDYRLDIYRLGYYGGQGARKVDTVLPSVVLPQVQPSCLQDSATGLIDCGNWEVSGSWSVPVDATSGIYLARAVRTDTSGASHIVFVVRDDDGASELLFQTADTTWQAYNAYGGNSLYTGAPVGRAYAVSYNRPFNTREVDGGQDWLFNAEYPMVRWLEANGYDVSYFTGVDSDRFGPEILEHEVFVSVGHDEYWSGDQRANVEAARDAGVNLTFFSGNEVFWKTRWEDSVDSTNTPYRTLVCYKETHANAVIDPADPPIWTGTWRDPRFSPPADGGRPENELTGTIFTVNAGATTSIRVPAEDGQMRFWRNTSIAGLTAGATATLPNGTLGYEWDEDLDNGFRPAGLIRLSTTTVADAPVLQDYGSTYQSDTATHHLTLYRHDSGALVFGAGTIQWSWGLDSNHDLGGDPADERMQQATVNLFADMGVQPATMQSGLVSATASSDVQSPGSAIASPASGTPLAVGNPVAVTGTANDVGGGVIGGVEVSVDSGSTWHPAIGRSSWTYTWTPNVLGAVTIMSRAVDDSGNLETPSGGVDVTVE
jgi:WD40 repeat protein